MTRKDYILIAAHIRGPREIPCSDKDAPVIEWATDTIARSMADALARDNSRFDRDRFLKACGVQS